MLYTQFISCSPKEKTKNFSCCHWNGNSLIAQKVSKISKLETYNSAYKYDFIYIFQMIFDSSVQEGDKKFQLDGYYLLRTDHPSNSKQESRNQNPTSGLLQIDHNLEKCQ